MELRSCITIPAPATAAWQVLGERFGEIAEWSDLEVSFLEGSCELGVGSVRVCGGAGWGPFPAGEVKEELVEFDREAMHFTYVGREGLPWFMPEAQNHWRVEAVDGGSCRVCTHASVRLVWWMRPLAPLLRLATRGPMRELLAQLSAAVETQARVPA